MTPLKLRDTPFRANFYCFLICFLMLLVNAQYGYGTAVIAAFQAMRGFLRVFGYRDPTLPAGWGIEPKDQQQQRRRSGDYCDLAVIRFCAGLCCNTLSGSGGHCANSPNGNPDWWHCT